MSEIDMLQSEVSGSGGDVAPGDRQLIIDALAKLRDGDFSDIDAGAFSDRELGLAYNDMLRGVSDRNNQILVRINDAMSRIAELGHLKALMDQVESQKDAIKSLDSAKTDLFYSMKQMEDSGYEMLALSRQIRNSYEPCTEELSEGYDAVHGSIGEVREAVEAIRKKFEAVKDIDPERAVAVERFVKSMETFTDLAADRAAFLKDTVDGMTGLGGRIEQVINDIVLINDTMERQNITSKTFLESVQTLSGSYEDLSADAVNIGLRLYRISRDIDNARNDIFRHNSRPTIHDILRVYEVDHLTLSWRVYNHIMELETMKITQINNPDRCKFGLWCAGMEDPLIRDSDAFKHAFDAHEELHKHAVASFMAKEDSDMALARKEFSKTLEGYEKFQMGMEELHTLYTSHGIMDETPLWKFK